MSTVITIVWAVLLALKIAGVVATSWLIIIFWPVALSAVIILGLMLCFGVAVLCNL